MKKFIEKLIAKLEEEENDAKCLWDDDAYYIGVANAFGSAIGIVNQLAEEYKEQNIDQDLHPRCTERKIMSSWCPNFLDTQIPL